MREAHHQLNDAACPAECYVDTPAGFCHYFVTGWLQLSQPFPFLGVQRSILGPFADLTKLHALSHGAQIDPVMTLCRRAAGQTAKGIFFVT